MKTSNMVPWLLALTISGLHAQSTSAPAGASIITPPSKPYHIVEVGANHRIWQRETYAAGPNGEVVTNVSKYIELAAGLYYQANGQWTESKEEIESYPGGALAQAGPYQVVFGNNLNSEGAVDLQSPEGKRFRSNILGLAYYDRATGNSVLIGQIQDSQGELIASNQVLYPDAFSGVRADVRYTYRRGQFEQDVILREQPPTPESLGLNAETTEIEVLTEFLNPPEARVKEHRETESALPDHEISWGGSWIGQGRAFALGEEEESAGPVAQVRVRREYATVQGRHILVEAVPLSKIGSDLQHLPLHASRPGKLPKTAAKLPLIPKTPMARVQGQPMKLASVTPPNQGYVLDYLQIHSSQTNFTFQGDTTYLISGANNFSGTVTFEGGTVLKFTTNSFGITVSSNIVCQTSPYRPAILTSMNDNTVGDGISGSTGIPTVSGEYLMDAELGTNAPLSNFRFSYATIAFMDYSPCLTNCQFNHCFWPVAVTANVNPSASVHNVLVARSAAEGIGVFVAQREVLPAVVVGEHLTVINSFIQNSYLQVTNSVFCNDTGLTSGAGSHNGFYNTPEFGDNAFTNTSYPYQAVGGGSFYLATNSLFHNAGTRSIDPAVLADIAARTTYPPVVYTGTILATASTLGPQARRDNSGAPDLGYHYDPLDYLMGGVDLTTNLTFTAGTAVGWYEAMGSSDNAGQPGNGYFGGQPYGMAIDDGGHLTLAGTATQPCHVALYNLVQEGNGNCTTYGWMAGFVLNGSGQLPLPQLTANFTKWSATVAYNALRDNWDYGIGALANCELYVNGLSSYGCSYSFTNCLIWRSWQGFANSLTTSATYQNCTFYNGLLSLNRSAGQSAAIWRILNCAFDGTAFVTQDGLNGSTNSTRFDYNAYNAADTNWLNFDSEWGMSGVGTLEAIGAHDLTTISNYNWQSGWFGNFYLPPNSLLLNAGSTTADKLGLYHFTTQTTQVPETNSIVDIGYHYVATDAYGNPLDANGDGIPDYLEDANGDGLVDNGETNWALGIVAQPVSQMAMVTEAATFSVVAAGLPTLSYQWYFNGTNRLVGQTNTTLTLVSVQTNNAGYYSLVVTNSFGAVTSSVAGLTTLNWNTTTPTNVGGSTAVIAISASAAGSCQGPFTYQWQHDGTNIGSIITTVAGVCNDLGVDSGDGGPATNAYLAFAAGVAVDATGNLYIADYGNNVVRQVNTSGIITTVAGNYNLGGTYSGDGGAATNAGLTSPYGVALDRSGNLYIADLGNAVIRRVDTNGIITTVAGNNYLAGNNPGNGYSGDGGAATNAVFNGPGEVAVDSAGNLYISDGGNGVIRRVDTNGIITTVAGKFQLAGTYSGDGGAATNAGLFPAGIAVDGAGNLYIADSGNGVIREVGTNGIIRTVAGNHGLAWSYSGDGGAATNAGLALPIGVGLDATGNLYIDDSGNNVIRKVDTNGNITTVAGDYQLGPGYSGDGNLATSGSLNYPTGVTVDMAGDIFIADNGNSVIREVVAPRNLNFAGGTLTLSNVNVNAAGTYQVTVTGPCGSIISTPVTLTVVLPPAITTQPANLFAVQGSNAIFSVTATGTAPLSYQWYYNGTNALSGGTNPVLALPNVQFSQAGTYSVVIANGLGSVTSATAVLTVEQPPVITSGPSSQTVWAGDNAQFFVSAAGTPLYYQWYINGTPALYGNASELFVNPDPTWSPTNFIQVLVYNDVGQMWSSTVTLTVLLQPLIRTAPVCTTGVVGGNASFSATVTGAAPLSYQWYANSLAITGATNATLLLTNVQPAQAGSYSLLVTNAYGEAFDAATLTVGQSAIAAWGSDFAGETIVPCGLTGVEGIAAGYYDSLALQMNGVVLAWGMNSTGQTNVPAGLSNVVAIAAGGLHNLALKADGTVSAWGFNNYGQTNVPVGLSNVVAVADGLYHSLALKADGTLRAWGNDQYGQTNVPAGLSNVVAIAAGYYHNLVLKGDGTVTAWGYNNFGQTNVPVGLSNVVAIATGGYHNLALRADGTVVGWGWNNFGQTNVPAGLTNVVAVAAGYYHNLVLEANGTVAAWGGDSAGQTNIPWGLTNVVAVACGNSHSLALMNEGSPVIFRPPFNQTVNAGAQANFSVVAVGPAPLAYQWQFNGANILGATNATLGLTNVQFGQAGVYTVLVSNAQGAVLSSRAGLTVLSPPFITSAPQSVTAAWGSNVTLSVTAAGTAPLNYQWYFNGTNALVGATNSSLVLGNVQAASAGDYSVVVTNNYGAVTSSVAGLTVTGWSISPPAVIAGGTAVLTLSASAACGGPYTYQWQHEGTNIGSYITTVAGNFSLGGSYSGDGGLAVNAGLNSPNDVAVDAGGNLYIADTINNVIRKVDASGRITTVAGEQSLGGTYAGDGGPAVSAGLSSPTSIALDNAGDLYIADYGNNIIRMVNASNGIITTVAGDYSATGQSGYDAAGGSYAGDGGPAVYAELSHPLGVTVDYAGNLYIGDANNGVVRMVDTTGVITTVAGNYDLNGGYSGDGGLATNAAMQWPGYVRVQTNSGAIDLYISDGGNNNIRQVEIRGGWVNGQFSANFANTPGIIETFSGPGVDEYGYTGDGGPVTGAEFNGPSGLAFDQANNLYIADVGNNVIRKVNSNGIITTYAGNHLFATNSNTGTYSGDGGSPTSAGLNFPVSVATDAAGNLYIADSLNNVIRKVVAVPNINIVGGTLTLSNVTTAAAGSYQVIISSACGSIVSSAATLTVLGPPVISAEPANGFGVQGGSASFSVTATGTAPLSYQWYFNGTNVLFGANGSTLVLTNIQAASEGNYSVVVTNNYGAVTSKVAGLTVTRWTINSPTILSGGTAVLAISASAAGGCAGPFTYQWQHDGTNLGSFITTVAGNASQGGTYTGDGGVAANAGLNDPSGASVTAGGQIYIADENNHVIRKVDTNGLITTVAGNVSLGGTYAGDGGAATNAGLAYPLWAVVDTAGNLYLADTSNNVIRKVDTNGIITTVAGNYSLGATYSGDGGAATNAGLASPSGLAFDGAGNLYIADTGNNVVREVGANGIITTVAGNYRLGGTYSGDGGAATNAALDGENGVAVDAVGNLYIADTGNEVVRKVDTNGNITTVAGNYNLGGTYWGDGGAATNAGLGASRWVAVDALGELYVTDAGNAVIRKVDTNGIITTVAGNVRLGGTYAGDGGAATNGGFNRPASAVVDAAGDLFIADSGNNVIREVVALGNASTLILSDVTANVGGNYQVILSGPCGSVTSSVAVLTVLVPPGIGLQPTNLEVGLGGSADLTFSVGASSTCGGPFTYQWQHDGTNMVNFITTAAGNYSLGGTYSGDFNIAANAGLDDPMGASVSAAGQLYIADDYNNVIREVDTNGIITTVAGNYSLGGTYAGDGGAAASAGLAYPSLALADATGNLYIADAGNNVIRRVDTNGIITTVAGNYNLGGTYVGDGGAATNAGLASPSGLAFDPEGNLYIADTGNNVIREVGTNGIITTVAGNNSVGGTYAGDGGPATNAALYGVEGITVDAAGNLYIADTGNNVVREVGTNGIITTVAGNNSVGGTYAGDGGPATNAALYGVEGVTVDAAGNLYIADTGNNVIRKVDTNGNITTVAGNNSMGGAYAGDGGAATNASFNGPAAAVLDAAGDLFIADSGNNVIREVVATGNSTSRGGTLSLPEMTGTASGNYQVIVSGPCGSVTSSVVNVTVGVSPTIVWQPASQAVNDGQNVTFRVAATGLQPMNCQWQFNGTNLFGQTNFSLTLSDVQDAEGGVYTAVVANIAGVTNSAPALLELLGSPIAHAGSAPTPLSVSLTAPANGQVFASYPTNIVLTATAVGGLGQVAGVLFYSGNYLVGMSTVAPYTFTWTNVTAGDYVLTAWAVDSLGSVAASKTVNITVDQTPTVAITAPANNSSVVAPANVSLSAVAASGEGAIAEVQFYAGSVFIGAAAPPYVLTWSNVPPGSWDLTAVAEDSLGLSATSSPVWLTVNPSSNLAANANAYVWDGVNSNANFGGSTILNVESSGTGTNRDAYFKFNLGGLTNVTSAKLSVYASLSVTGAVSAAVYSVTNTSWQESTITWSNKPARVVALGTNTLSGTNGAWYQFDVTAYVRTNSGVISLALHEPTNSAALISVNALENSSNNPVLMVTTTNALPTVSITSPGSNTVYATPVGNIAITAAASDATGVAGVQYFAGTNSVGATNSIGAATVAPYTLVWNNPPLGTNWLRAVAVGNGGLSATSTVVSVIVDIPPVVTLTNPVNNVVFVTGTNINLGAAASDADGTVKQVQFFQGTTSLGVSTTAPYGCKWSNVAIGRYTLTAVASDNNGITTTSAPVNIVVDSYPAVAITSPASSSSFGAPTNVVINATASATDGTSPQVQFFVGNNLLGTVGSAPYSFVWNNPLVGTYALRVVATDDYGLASTATVTNITVSSNLVANANAYVWDGVNSNANFGGSTILNVESSGTGTNRDAYFKFNLGGLTNVSSAKLRVYASLSVTGAVSAAVYTVTNTGWQESTITWSNRPARVVALGTNTLSGTNGAWYQFDVTAYVRTNSGVISLALHEPTNSAALISLNALENSSNNPALILITTNAPPTVNIFSPGSNTVYAVPFGVIPIMATASDVTGVVGVQYFTGTNSAGVTNSLGAMTTGVPYTLAWNNPPLGTNWLRAVAVGNGGLSATSTVVSVIVDLPPAVTLTNPVNNAFFLAGTNITLGAAASDADGTVKQVQFFQGTTSLGVSATAPYAFKWSNVAAGNYALTAVASDNNGVTTTSAPVNILVDAYPAVAITSPAASSSFGAPTSVVINAKASATDGTSPQVQFFVGNNLLGTVGSAPYSFVWNNPVVGTYVLKAVATDDYGLVSTATVTNITVSSNLVANANAYVWDGVNSNANFGGSTILNVESSGTGTNRDAYFKFNLGSLTNVSSAKLSVYASLSVTGAVSAAVYAVTNTSWLESTITWSNKPARVLALSTNTLSGTNGVWYQFDVTAYVRTNSGVISLALHEPTNSVALISVNALENSSNNPALIIITTNAPPTVSIVSPTNTTVYAAPVGSVSVTVTASPMPKLANVAKVAKAVAVINGGGGGGGGGSGSAPPVASIAITAAASDVTGVAGVQFFAGTNSVGATNSIGMLTVAPYSLVWNNPPLGTNWLRAVAVGNGGLSATSAVVSVIMDIPPVVTLTNPVNNAFFVAGTNITLGAAASDPDGTVKQVQFFQGTTSLGVSTTAPYVFKWSNVAAGNYALTAVASDNNGLTTTSAAVNIVVDAYPVVAITSPASGSSFGASTNVVISATAAATDGTSPQVQFFAGNLLLGTVSKAPYSFVWNNPTVGAYTLKVVATDDYGLASTAMVTNITVGSTVVANANAYVWDGVNSNANFGGSTILNVESSGTGTNRDAYFKFNLGGLTNVISAKLSVYASLSVTGAVSAAVYTVTNTSWQESTITWSNKPARVVALSTNTLSGTNGVWYQFDVTAYVRTNSGVISLALHGPTNSAALISLNALENSSNNPALIIFTTNAPPTVSITSPANNATLLTPANLISAAASDPTGIAQVQFYQGAINFGTATALPYNALWSNVSTGAFTLTAIAINNAGLAATSAVVNVQLKAPATITQQPVSQTIEVGQSATFNVSATGTKPLYYQWYSNNVALAGATNVGLLFTNAQSADTASYSVVVTNNYSSATSVPATLTVLVAPVIVGQPANLSVLSGSNVTFTVVATGSSPLTYRWYEVGAGAIAGATGATLAISNVQAGNAGDYFVLVSNGAGLAVSDFASLTVITKPTADTDYDGRSDGQELVDGTDPLNPNSVLPVLLGAWSFNDTNLWSGSAGQLPLAFSNIAGIVTGSTNAGLFGITNAVLIDSPSAALLAYRDVETSGSANINCRSGTVSFWFRPDWNSGTGPGVMGRLLEMGNYNPAYTNGWWALYVNPTGTQLSFGSSTNGAGTVNLTVPIAWVANQWHQIVLTYGPTNSSLYLDGGAVATNGVGAVYYPNLSERSQGFRIGSDAAGNNQARGAFDDLETYNYPLTALGVINIPVASDGNGILNVIIDSPANGAVLQ